MFQNYGRTKIHCKIQIAITFIRKYASRGTVSGCVTTRANLYPVKVSRYAQVPEGYYGGRHMITMLPGSGIGPEMMEHVIKIYNVVNAPIDFEVIPIRSDHYKVDLDYAVMSFRRNGACIKAGNIEDVKTPHDVASANVEIRRQLDLHACVTHCTSQPGVNTRHEHINLVLIRQNTEGEYSSLEHENKKGVVESMKIVTERNSKIFAKWMYTYCLDKRRKRIAIVHKSAVLKLTDGLFLKTITDMAQAYPHFEIETHNIDSFCMNLVQNPQVYDVVVSPNLYGGVITNIACGLTGGGGLTSCCNYGKKYALFETATRNSAVEMAGQDIANPVAVIRAAADLLWHLHHEYTAYSIRRAILRTLRENVTTPDLGGKYKASEVVNRISDYIKEDGPTSMCL